MVSGLTIPLMRGKDEREVALYTLARMDTASELDPMGRKRAKATARKDEQLDPLS